MYQTCLSAWPTSIKVPAHLSDASQEESGKCGSECKTLQRAVEDVLGDHDTDIAEKLWQARPLGRPTPLFHAPSRGFLGSFPFYADSLCREARLAAAGVIAALL
jgi:hypothetical protein